MDDMNQCTCSTDKEATCIVHPTTRSLKEYIAYLEAIRDAADYRRVIWGLKQKLCES